MKSKQIITQRKINNRLRKLQEYMQDNHLSINSGGCGIFAHLVGKKLKRLGLSVEVVTPTYGKSAALVRDKVSNRNDPMEWSNNGLSRAHLALRFKSKSGTIHTYDSEAFIRSSNKFGSHYECDYKFGEGLTVEETKLMCKPRTGWNCWFDRSEVPALRKKINEIFKDLGV